MEIVIAIELFIIICALAWFTGKAKDALALLQTISNRAQLVKEAIMYVHKNEQLFLTRLLNGGEPEPDDAPDFVKKIQAAHSRKLN